MICFHTFSLNSSDFKLSLVDPSTLTETGKCVKLDACGQVLEF